MECEPPASVPCGACDGAACTDDTACPSADTACANEGYAEPPVVAVERSSPHRRHGRTPYERTRVFYSGFLRLRHNFPMAWETEVIFSPDEVRAIVELAHAHYRPEDGTIVDPSAEGL